MSGEDCHRIKSLPKSRRKALPSAKEGKTCLRDDEISGANRHYPCTTVEIAGSGTILRTATPTLHAHMNMICAPMHGGSWRFERRTAPPPEPADNPLVGLGTILPHCGIILPYYITI